MRRIAYITAPSWVRGEYEPQAVYVYDDLDEAQAACDARTKRRNALINAKLDAEKSLKEAQEALQQITQAWGEFPNEEGVS